MANLKHHPQYWLRDDAAAAFDRAEDDHGVLTVTDAGRTVAQQQHLIDLWNQGGSANRPPYLYQPAMPATASNHVKDGGIAVDIGNYAQFASYCEQYGFTHSFPNSDPVHFDFHGVAAPAPASAPAGAASNPFGISDVRGLQKIAKMYGGNTAPDNIFGVASKAGFAAFLRRNWGYVGNDELGPVMWSAIAKWLRARYGYVGNDVPGPIMRGCLQSASNANFAQL